MKMSDTRSHCLPIHKDSVCGNSVFSAQASKVSSANASPGIWFSMFYKSGQLDLHLFAFIYYP